MIYGFTNLRLVILAASLVATLLGLVVGYQAYRGFRRHQSASMRQLSVGLLLLTAVSFTLAFVGTLLLRAEYLDPSLRDPLTLVVRLLQVAGLALITYSLYNRPD
ncbi:hypothetical protein L593_00010 [Salinarchaeum sp. Harcht-Bsk1]|uniref:DUF7521 family protein n=1 Tax=Salinarchaeum sp. Harcht-Bsk1 TaxID=1333523 RepID=UPI0003424087|nr:hypothetical protein [Salinarchaeum sp. Harcht-Bsk1]AGM99956.1 hypothetical protein L593_00010 [Salinarchaeum sp. Harcht-Bsk1]